MTPQRPPCSPVLLLESAPPPQETDLLLIVIICQEVQRHNSLCARLVPFGYRRRVRRCAHPIVRCRQYSRHGHCTRRRCSGSFGRCRLLRRCWCRRWRFHSSNISHDSFGRGGGRLLRRDSPSLPRFQRGFKRLICGEILRRLSRLIPDARVGILLDEVCATLGLPNRCRHVIHRKNPLGKDGA